MKQKKNNILLLSATIVVALNLTGCSKPKVIEYKPYPSNTYIYREIVDNNKIEWRESLFDDVKEYQNYISSVFNKIDKHKKYLKKEYNINKIKKKKAKKAKKDIDGLYRDVVLDDEYSF